MTVELILGFLAKGMLTGLGSQIAKRGFEGLIQWLKTEAKKAGQTFRTEDEMLIRKILGEDHSFGSLAWNILLSQVKLVDRKGLAIVGPSGVGKTALYNYFTGQHRIEPVESTSERVHRDVRFRARYVRVADTPGSIYHVNLERETYDYVERHKIGILIIVLAYGYLDTVGIPGLRRPGESTENEAKTLKEYLDKARQEELRWLEDFVNLVPNPKRKIPYCMVVRNKLDHWYEEAPDVESHYEAGPAEKYIDALVDKFCRPDIKASFHNVACTYDSFKGRKAPTKNLSREGARFSLAVLRAEVARRL